MSKTGKSFAVGLFLGLVSVTAYGYNLVGGVTAIVTSGGTGGTYPTIFSNGEADSNQTCDAVTHWTLNGTHQIVNLVSQNFTRSCSHYFANVSGPGNCGNCYTASLYATLSGAGATTWISSVCPSNCDDRHCPPERYSITPLMDATERTIVVVEPEVVRAALSRRRLLADDPWCPIGGDTPILIDLGNEGFPLSGSNDPVRFDLDANGQRDPIGWTARGSQVAFLVLDRNGNGRVDDGSELFGNHTPLMDGSIAQNGYEALAEFDTRQRGGNEDGSIGPEDAVWNRLRLWTDANHDGVCQRSELQSLDEAGVTRLGYAFHWSRRHDQYGNDFRAKSTAQRETARGRIREVNTWDVVFARLQ